MGIPGSDHQQYPVIAALGKALSARLSNAILHDAYSLSKEELVIVFQLREAFFSIKIIQRYRSCFMLFESYQPERGSNAQPCFMDIINGSVQSLEQHQGTRSFALHFGGGYQLVFKLYDALVNVALYKDQTPVDLFRKSITADWEIPLKEVIGSNEQTSQPIASTFYIYKRNHQHPYYFSIDTTSDELIFQSDDVLQALHEFSRLYLGYYHFEQQKQSAATRIREEIKKLSALVMRTREGLKQLETQTTPEEIANIIMANLHAIQSQLTSVELYDFYHDQPITVKLKKELNPQQNAAWYYRKAKNSRQEEEQLLQKLDHSEARIAQLNMDVQKVEVASSLKDLKPYLPKVRQQEAQFPFRQFEHEGYQIWVGKSAANNDELTMKHAHKNDLWLHAKDVGGSHVVLKWKPGREFPMSVITRAAEIAAYYSKLKGSTLVPVSYTLKKFVRKPKGAEPGSVMVDKEEVVMVEPKL